jgi:hypothetical protein
MMCKLINVCTILFWIVEEIFKLFSQDQRKSVFGNDRGLYGVFVAELGESPDINSHPGKQGACRKTGIKDVI